MSKVKNTQNETKVSEQKTKIDKINLSKFTEQLSKVELKEKRKKETIFVYPENFSQSDINSEKGKKFRNAARNQIKRFANNILAFAKQAQVSKDETNLKKEVKLFQEFYKSKYRLNDYSFNSIASKRQNESDEQLIKLMLEVIKEVIK